MKHNKIYNLILKYKTEGQKAKTIAEYLQQKYPEKIDISYNNFKTHKKYRNICLTQKPIQMKMKMLREYINAIHFIRPNYITYGFIHKATNGFSIYKAETKYNYFIPMMYDYQNKNINADEISIGYYFSIYRNNFGEFIEFLKENKNKIKYINILGKILYEDFYYNMLTNIDNNFNIHFYQNKDEFFSNITHLVFPMSKTFLDPWPTVLEEGVRCNKQIIILHQDRNWQDGIDDICSCIRYHTKLNLNTYYDNSDSSIVNFDLDKYYNYLFNNNFEFYIDRKKFKTFDDFLSRWDQ